MNLYFLDVLISKYETRFFGRVIVAVLVTRNQLGMGHRADIICISPSTLQHKCGEKITWYKFFVSWHGYPKVSHDCYKPNNGDETKGDAVTARTRNRFSRKRSKSSSWPPDVATITCWSVARSYPIPRHRTLCVQSRWPLTSPLHLSTKNGCV